VVAGIFELNRIIEFIDVQPDTEVGVEVVCIPVKMITGKSAAVRREPGRLCTVTFKLFLAGLRR
jgi:hypothetical protein